MSIAASISSERESTGGGEVVLEARGVSKTYRLGRVEVPVLRGVDMSVRRGECVAILGASGSGKSTLLHLLGGLDRPDRVQAITCPSCKYSRKGLSQLQCPECGASLPSAPNIVRFEGRELSTYSASEFDAYRAGSVGFVFQFYHLLPELTVLNNVRIAAMIRWGHLGYRARRGAVTERAEMLLRDFGLAERLTHRPAELSGGERQRVAIARALINEPPVLLADEPTGNLDRTTGQHILDLLMMQRQRAGLTMVMVTHDPEVAARADRVVRLVDGKVGAG